MAQSSASDERQRGLSHGRRDLGCVFVDGYGEDVRAKDGYFGDRASHGAFSQLISDLRAELAKSGGDPLQGEPDELTRKRIDRLIREGDAPSVGVILSVIEHFARNLADVAASLFQLRSWSGVERIAVGGGFRDSRVGELVIGRTGILVREFSDDVEVIPIHHHPDDAGLIGAAMLFPVAMFEGREHAIGVDIGGSNFRCGLVALKRGDAGGWTSAEVLHREIWRHGDEETSLDVCMQRLQEMLAKTINHAERRALKLAPLIGVGVPGTVLEDGGLEGGVLNLPGDWRHPAFNLPQRIRTMIPLISGEPTQVAMHNDAVVQGLSEAPWMADVEKWAVMTIGTGLGNAVFRNKEIVPK